MRLPAQFGCTGMSFDDSVADSRHKHADSMCTANLTQQIIDDRSDLMHSIELDRGTKATVWQRYRVDGLQACLYYNELWPKLV